MYIKEIKGTFLALFFVTTALSLFQWLSPRSADAVPVPAAEKYDSRLAYLTSVNQATRWLDSTAALRDIKPSSRDYVDLADSLIRLRFVHGYSYYRPSDDYISYLLGRLVWSDLSAIVDPDDILKFNRAACSQQAIVFMAILRQKGYRTRKVSLKGHFCTGVLYEGQWHFYDSNKEPRFSKAQPIPSSLELMTNKNLAYQAYSGILTQKQVDEMFSEVTLEESDALPGYRVRVLHGITCFLSRFGWAMMGLGYLLSMVAERLLMVKYVRHHRVPVIQ
ncbi:MAG TPA: hypothetical protein VF646_20295 [Cytophagales bacterium]|jgi:hypothetical protein